jgi:hypothetical protein
MATQMFSVESSNILALGYEQSTSTMVAEFKGGSIYLYDGVPLKTFAAVLSAESVGGEFNTLIKKGGFQYRKVEAANASA